MSSTFKAFIKGVGFFVPEKVVTNQDLEKLVDTTDEWITTRTGIKERRIAEPGTKSSDLGTKAAKQAIESAGLTAADLDLIVVATITPDMFFPSTACAIQNNLGASCGAFDMAAACSGFPYALSVAEAYIATGRYNNILVVGSEVLSGFIDWSDRATCVLFGDGAGAAIVSRTNDESCILASKIGSDGSLGSILEIPGGGSANPTSQETLDKKLHYLRMQGADVFKVAVRTMELAINDLLKSNGYTIDDVDWVIPHQANIRILTAVADRIKVPIEKVVLNLDRYGNMSSASTVVALTEAVQQKKVRKGNLVVLVAFGGGLTWSATLIRW